MYVLGIETTCDETACAVVVDGKKILSNVIYSQAEFHSRFGGVVPELASRQHVDVIQEVLDKSLSQAGCKLSDIDLIAVAKGPGLMGSLLVGITFAKSLAWALKKPLVGVNHVEAHLYAAIMTKENSTDQPTKWPALGMVLSGSHTSIVKIFGVGQYQLLGETIDDAIGEAFDKTAKILGLGYPGGPILEKLALQGDPNRFALKAGFVKTSPLDFSFSGIKTAVLYTVKKIAELTDQDRADIAASFQQAVFQDICSKLEKVRQVHPNTALFFGGGVTQNKTLRALLDAHFPKCTNFPLQDLCLDNAAMIAGLGYHVYQASGQTPVEPETKIPFSRENTSDSM